MRITTRAVRLRQAIAHVWKRLPPAEQARIDGFLTVIRAHRWWEAVGINIELDTAGGELLPFVRLRKPGPPGAQLLFHLPVCRLFSDVALRGIVAHEFAHASRAAQLGAGWYEKMMASYNKEERKADALAIQWGFGREIGRGRNVEGPKVARRIALMEPTIQRRWLRQP